MGNKTKEHSNAKKNKAGLFHGIQAKILSLTIFAVLVSVGLFLLVGVMSFSSTLTGMVKDNMEGIAKTYGTMLFMMVRNNGNEMLDYSGLSQIFADATMEGMEDSYCYVVDSAGTMLYHPDETKVGQPVENVVVSGLVQQIQAGETPEPNAVEYDYRGTVKLAGYYILRGNSAIVVITADKDTALLVLNSFVTRCCLVALAILAIVGTLGTVIARSIAKPIGQLTDVIDQNAALDFTESVVSRKLSKGKGETGIMSNALDSMRGNLVNMVEKLGDTADRLRLNADGLNEIVEEMNSNSCDNSATSQQLAASMQETSATTQIIDEKMGGVNDNAKKISQLTEDGEKNAAAIIEKAEGLRKTVEEANAKTQEIYSRMKKESDLAIEKAKEISRINALTDAIAAIASQTELLSLNASIEAARAGEAGRGFAVVAGEIGNLAAQSTDTAKNITTIVAGVEVAARSMEDCLAQMIQFMEEKVSKDYETFIGVSEEYSTDARGFSGDMKTINDSITMLEENISDIAHSIEDINRTVNEAAISVNDIAEKASDMVGYAGDTGQKASDNAEFARELDEIVKQFKV